MSNMEPKLTIRVTGLGHKLTLKDLPAGSTTVADLRDKVEEATGLPPRFQKFIGPQKLNIGDASNDNKTLAELNVQDRTRLMLLHSPIYQVENKVYQQLKVVQEEIEQLQSRIKKKDSEVQKPGYVAEMVTRLCCKLDAIDTAGSKELRAHRKELIQKAEGLEAYADKNKR